MVRPAPLHYSAHEMRLLWGKPTWRRELSGQFITAIKKEKHIVQHKLGKQQYVFCGLDPVYDTSISTLVSDELRDTLLIDTKDLFDI